MFIGDREKWRELNEAIETCSKEYEKIFSELNLYVSKMFHKNE